MIRAELILVNGERRSVALPDHTGSIANALGRLDDWIKTEDGAWVQKSFIVEVQAVNENPAAGSEELAARSDQDGTLTPPASESQVT